MSCIKKTKQNESIRESLEKIIFAFNKLKAWNRSRRAVSICHPFGVSVLVVDEQVFAGGMDPMIVAAFDVDGSIAVGVQHSL